MIQEIIPDLIKSKVECKEIPERDIRKIDTQVLDIMIEFTGTRVSVIQFDSYIL